MRVISIIGHERVGKNYTADALKIALESKGYNIEMFANADALKNLACKNLGISLETLEHLKEINQPIFNNYVKFENIREYLIWLSEDVIKPIFGQTVWADIFRKKVSETSSDFIIKTDDRYAADIEPNPANTIYIGITKPGVYGIEGTPYFDFVNKTLENSFSISNDVDANLDPVGFKKKIHTILTKVLQ